MTPYNQILELFNTKEDNYLEKIMECFKTLNSVQEMQDIIERFEKLNESWKSRELKDFISQLAGIKWQLQHFQKGQKKVLQCQECEIIHCCQQQNHVRQDQSLVFER